MQFIFGTVRPRLPRDCGNALLAGLAAGLCLTGVSCLGPVLPPGGLDLQGRLVTVGVVADNAPFSQFDEADRGPVGFDVDLVEALADRLNFVPHYVRVTRDAALDGLVAGEYELLVGGVAYSFSRAERVSFAAAYALLKERLLVRADEARCGDIAGFAQSPALSTGAVAGSIQHESAERMFGPDRVRLYTYYYAALDALSAHEIDGVVLGEMEARWVLEQAPEAFRALPGAFAGDVLALALPFDSALIDPLNIAYGQLQLEGAIEILRRKWGL